MFVFYVTSNGIKYNKHEYYCKNIIWYFINFDIEVWKVENITGQAKLQTN